MRLEYVQWLRDGRIPKMTGFLGLCGRGRWDILHCGRRKLFYQGHYRAARGHCVSYQIYLSCCRVSNSEHLSKLDGIDIEQGLAQRLDDVDARWSGESSAL